MLPRLKRISYSGVLWTDAHWDYSALTEDQILARRAALPRVEDLPPVESETMSDRVGRLDLTSVPAGYAIHCHSGGPDPNCEICNGLGEVVPERHQHIVSDGDGSKAGKPTGRFLPATPENCDLHVKGGGDLGVCSCETAAFAVWQYKGVDVLDLEEFNYGDYLEELSTALYLTIHRHLKGCHNAEERELPVTLFKGLQVILQLHENGVPVLPQYIQQWQDAGRPFLPEGFEELQDRKPLPEDLYGAAIWVEPDEFLAVCDFLLTRLPSRWVDQVWRMCDTQFESIPDDVKASVGNLETLATATGS